MFFICNAMPKSASSFLNNLEKEALALKFGREGQKALDALIKSGELSGSGNFIGGAYDEALLERLDRLAQQHGPFVVKAHVPINPALEAAVDAGRARISYVYRFPHDVVLSVLDHHKSNPQQFRNFTDVPSAIRGVKGFCNAAIRWKASRKALMLRYEPLVAEPLEGLTDVLRHFGIELPPEQLTDIIERTRAQQLSPSAWNLRFNKGVSGRYKQELSPADIALCDREFKPFLAELGY